MLRSLVLSMGLVAVLAGPAAADSTCVAPYAPTILSTAAAATATKEQVLVALRDVKVFLADSEIYQDCMVRDLAGQRARAARDKKEVDQSIVDDIVARISANQREKERVRDEWNTTVNAYKAAHPAEQ